MKVYVAVYEPQSESDNTLILTIHRTEARARAKIEATLADHHKRYEFAPYYLDFHEYELDELDFLSLGEYKRTNGVLAIESGSLWPEK